MYLQRTYFPKAYFAFLNTSLVLMLICCIYKSVVANPIVLHSRKLFSLVFR